MSVPSSSSASHTSSERRESTLSSGRSGSAVDDGSASRSYREGLRKLTLSLALQEQARALRAGRDVLWEVRVANDGPEPVVLAFRTSQRGDVALEQDGVERWRWSDGQMFLQVLGERELAPGEIWSFTLEGALDVEPGVYEAVATVSSEPAAAPARQRVVVEKT